MKVSYKMKALFTLQIEALGYFNSDVTCPYPVLLIVSLPSLYYVHQKWFVFSSPGFKVLIIGLAIFLGS